MAFFFQFSLYISLKTILVLKGFMLIAIFFSDFKEIYIDKSGFILHFLTCIETVFLTIRL